MVGWENVLYIILVVQQFDRRVGFVLFKGAVWVPESFHPNP